MTSRRRSVRVGGLGPALRRARRARGMTQEELAAVTDLTQRTISMIENGRQRPRWETLSRLVGALDADLYQAYYDPEAAPAQEPREVRKMPDGVAKGLIPLADSLARRHARWSGEADELRGAALDGMLEAWGKHDPDGPVPFRKLAAKYMKWRVRDRLDRLKRDRTTTNHGLRSAPRFVREYLDAGGADEDPDNV